MNKHKENNKESLLTAASHCLYCGQVAELVWVHGHGQCSHCGINTQECCRGESCESFANKEY